VCILEGDIEASVVILPSSGYVLYFRALHVDTLIVGVNERALVGVDLYAVLCLL
jgi:hypothetical protein